jgi:hypothetical protein
MTTHDYPSPPEPFGPLESVEPPSEPGVYFAFDGHGETLYVGRAMNLRSRMKRGHHRLREDHSVSWLCFPERELGYAEAYYIGILRPTLNGEATADRASVARKQMVPVLETARAIFRESKRLGCRFCNFGMTPCGDHCVKRFSREAIITGTHMLRGTKRTLTR